jgi:BirA family biotin operon repressor/biotin-[acetyl-CoA-carboxylase] ligase
MRSPASSGTHSIDGFDSAEIQHALKGSIYTGNIHLFQQVDSTNNIAMQQGCSGAAHGSVYVANEQIAGRGRGDHRWVSPAGTGLYVSILLRPAIHTANILWLSLLTGLAVHHAVQTTCGLQADLRWPNDMLLGTRKFCGILTEMQAEQQQVKFAVIGIGINVNQHHFPHELREIATSLCIETGRNYSRQDLLIELLKSLQRELQNYESHTDQKRQQNEILSRLQNISTWIHGKKVAVGQPEEFRGTTDGLDERGFLRVMTDNGIRTVMTGGIREG